MNEPAAQPMSSLRHRISIDVETTYLDDQSEPREQRYVFAYTVTIRNEGEVPAKLLTRHWIITDANGRVQEVRGDGGGRSAGVAVDAHEGVGELLLQARERFAARLSSRIAKSRNSRSRGNRNG